MDKVGVIHGRFQMLHNGHMEYLLAGKSRCDYLLIGITNPDVILTKASKSNPNRSLLTSNPLTFYERFQMTRGAMVEAGVSIEEFDIVPFPINHPELLLNYVPRDAKFYMTIYDDWSMEKQSALESLGCSIDIMWTRTNDEKITSGTEVRSRIAQGKSWKQLVPQFVYSYAVGNGIDIRIRNQNKEESYSIVNNN